MGAEPGRGGEGEGPSGSFLCLPFLSVCGSLAALCCSLLQRVLPEGLSVSEKYLASQRRYVLLSVAVQQASPSRGTVTVPPKERLSGGGTCPAASERAIARFQGRRSSGSRVRGHTLLRAGMGGVSRVLPRIHGEFLDFFSRNRPGTSRASTRPWMR